MMMEEFKAGWREQVEARRRLWPWLLALTLLTFLAHWLLFGRPASLREVVIEGCLAGICFGLGRCAPRCGGEE